MVEWCNLNHLQLNITKTKEMIVDYRKQASIFHAVTIRGMDIEVVEDYKYLRVYINSKLDWSRNTNIDFKKGQSRLYLLYFFFFKTNYITVLYGHFPL